MAIKMAKKVKIENGVRFEFADSKGTKIELLLSELPKDMLTELAIHGLSQKAGDSYSGLDVVADGIASVKEVWANLKAGKFNAGGGTGGLLAEAVARIKGVTVEKARELLDAATEEQVEALKKNAKVKATITVIKGERAAGKAADEEDADLGI